ncbi:PorV/PorQ family protein [candidate division KSB1 bacterium]|nr:PorV/PorQ family protein [candidate division KSB1 bacterium]
MKKTRLLIFLTMLPTFSLVYAEKYAAEFLTVGIGARALAMGGAFVPVSDDASAAYWNPAGLIQLNRREIHFMHASRFSDMVQTDVFNVILPGKKFVFGLNYLRMGIDNIPYTRTLNANGRPLIEKYISDTEEAAFLSFGATLNPKLSLGGNVKLLRQNIGDNSSLGFGLDLGLFYRLNSAFRFGAILQDISGTHVYWNTGHRDTKMPDLKYGLAYKKSFLFLRSHLLFTVQQNIRFEGRSYGSQLALGDIANSDFQFGGEYELMDILALRLGSFGDDLTAGAGLGFKMLRIDYAFMSYELGNAHRVSASVRF